MQWEGPPGRTALRPSPDRRSTQRRLFEPGSSLSLARRRPMLSMPLAYPSTLDRRPLVAHVPSGRRPTWRSFGARASAGGWKIHRQKHTLIASVNFQRTALRVFLSQAGPRFDLELVQAEHHLWFRRCLIALKTKKATRLGRPRLACYAPRDLARTPPSEGYDVTGPAVRIDAMPARQGRGGRRFGKEGLGVDRDQHRVGG